MARAVFEGQTLKKEVERNERKGESGICRIQKRIGNHGYQTVGSGSLIKHQIDPKWKSEYFIVTTKEVFEGDFDVKNYRVDFVKSGSKLKTIKLHGAVVDDEILPYPSGLALILLDPNSSLFRHGLFGKNTCSILTYRPFEVESFNNVNTRDDTFANGLCCYMVADYASSTSFGVKLHELTRDSHGQYVVRNLRGHDVPPGAAILRKVATKWNAVGVFSSTSDTSLPIWLSKENLDANFRPGE